MQSRQLNIRDRVEIPSAETDPMNLPIMQNLFPQALPMVILGAGPYA